MSKIITWVESHFSAAHDPQDGGPVHGHTWQVRAGWEFTGGDAAKLRNILDSVCRTLDHRTLPPELSRGEQIAAHIGRELNAYQVDVWRGPERIGCSWIS